MSIEVSIIMPVYNAEKFLLDAVNSITNQSFKNFELILVDDGSQDKSGIICDELMQKDERIKVIHKTNGGICSARNTGLKAANGKYIMFMDNDDILDTDTIKHNYELLIENNADWVKFAKTEILIHEGKVLNRRKSNFIDGIYSGNEIIEKMLYLKKMDVMTFVWDSIFSKEIIQNNNIVFDTEFKQGNEDIDFCEIYAKYSKKLVVNSKSYYNHYTRMGISASSKYSESKIESCIYLLGKCNARYKTYNIDMNMNKNAESYIYVVTKQVIANICEKLNAASKELSVEQRKNVLKNIYERPEMKLYVSQKGIQQKHLGRKLFIYYTLFNKKKFKSLLFFDKYSRRLVYSWRKIKNVKKKD